MAKVAAGVAMLRVMKAWGIDRVYGIPGGSFNSTMDALYKEQGTVDYIQVRHEEAGALAAAAGRSKTLRKNRLYLWLGWSWSHSFDQRPV